MNFEVSGAVRMFVCLAVCTAALNLHGADKSNPPDRAPILVIDPPEQGFFAKQLDFHGIPIKSHAVVVDEALYAAHDRLRLLFTHLITNQPMVISNLVVAGAALHIIGRDQVTTDLPEWRHDKHVPLDEYNDVPLDEYNGLTRDQRTRGMGGRLTSCGEENLLKLPGDRYRGRDICLHEFAHNVLNNGCQREIRTLFADQRQKSLEAGLWVGSYAGSNTDEFFAELTMWYFGTHGSLGMSGPKPEPGPGGLKQYDPAAFALMDDFYRGRIEVTRKEPRLRPRAGTSPRRPRDSQAARALVERLSSYKVGETTMEQFFADAGMAGPEDQGREAWHVARQDGEQAGQNPGTASEHGVAHGFRVSFRNPARNRNHSIADLEFSAGILESFVWSN